MKQRTHVVLLAALVSATAWAQEVSVTSTTLAQYWKQEIPGFDQSKLAPVTQFLGVDATGLGTEGLSMHLYGWGALDLADPSMGLGKKSDGSLNKGKKSDGYLSYGYLDYRFAQANAEIKAGRFTINQGLALEQVDGVSARTDLRGGFTISAFGGRPIRYRTADLASQSDYEYQNDVIFGSRLALRILKFGEVGVSFLQDGTTSGKDLKIPSPVDYTRKQVGIDLNFSPSSKLDFSGRTVYDVARHSDTPSTLDPKPSRIAEHDYTLTAKVLPNLGISGNFTERNLQAYFAGTNLPSLFNQGERDAHRSYEGRVIWGTTTELQLVVDFRHTHRDTYGNANRFGGDLRWIAADAKLKSGLGFHRVNAADVPTPGLRVPFYSLSHSEVRGWIMAEGERFSGSLDGILQSFDDRANPLLNGKSAVYQVVASLGFRSTADLKFSGDVSYGATGLSLKEELRGLLRVEFRLGTASKGGSK